MKILKVRREHVDFDAHGKLSVLDPNGMPWFGECIAHDHIGDFRAITGKVTTGPAEWVGLRIVVFGGDEDEFWELTPILPDDIVDVGVFATRYRGRVNSIIQAAAVE